MAFIRIIATPSGEAPEHIRSAWVGVVLPVSDVTEQQLAYRELVERGVLGGTPDDHNHGGYHVETAGAIAILKVSNREAGEWWEKCVNPRFMPYLIFGKQYCEVVSR